MSVERADRTGPTEPGSSELNTAARRVTPPSTCSSNTMSAWFIPDSGRARGPLSIFTTRADPASANQYPTMSMGLGNTELLRQQAIPPTSAIGRAAEAPATQDSFRAEKEAPVLLRFSHEPDCSNCVIVAPAQL